MRRAVLCLLSLSLPTATAEPTAFDTAVAPLLVRHCLDCHSGPKPKGKLDLSRRAAVLGGANPVVRPSQLEDSPLWTRVAANEMPPKKPLPDADKQVLRDWIARGAPWGTDPIDPFRITTDRRAGYDWWALRPVQRPVPPEVKTVGFVRNAIDRFILARLEAARLAPSPEADRRTLVRRLSFDLLGLPPTPEEVDAFVADPTPDAYGQLVDRLLASLHYGERWGRHWLDVVRFGESDGFERNTTRPNAWPYRDWVIRALNDDLPYDEFCRLQLAGDVLWPGDHDAACATGFLVAGIHNTVLGSNADMRELARQDELEDLVGCVGQTFLGLTVNCGRCHDHKFDPVSQHDYYRFASDLAGVRHGERELPVPDVRAEAAQLGAVAEPLRRQLALLEEPVWRQLLGGKSPVLGAAPLAPVAAWDFRTGLHDRVGSLHGQALGSARVTPQGLVLDGKGHVRTAPLGSELREKTLEVWVRLADRTQQGGGAMGVQTGDGHVFDAVVYGEREAGRWMAGSEFFRRTQSLRGPEETEADRRVVQVVLAYHADGTIVGYRDGKPHGKPYAAGTLMAFPAGNSVVQFGCRHGEPGGNRLLRGTLVQARLYDRALTATEVATTAALGDVLVREEEFSSRLSATARAERAALKTRLAELDTGLARLRGREVRKVYAALTEKPPVTRLLVRGQVTEPTDVVAPGTLAALAGSRPDFGLAPDAPEGERRRRLAVWLTRPDNPLFARVLVNRLWHGHFGTGIVETPSDFGFNGGRPSHPELLDWLAAEFAARGYRMKEMHRLIVTSAAYRQASAPRRDGLATDAESRLLWRKKPLRLEGEVLRDAMLRSAGLLNSQVGGRGFSDYRENSFNGTTYFDPIDPVGPEYHRRSIYRFSPRGGNQGLLDAFDCPDPAAAAPRRSVTTTPLQALALWNGGFALRQAAALAAQVEAEAEPRRRVEAAFRRVFQRTPRPEEQTAAERLVRGHGLEALCRALFNANEFVTAE